MSRRALPGAVLLGAALAVAAQEPAAPPIAAPPDLPPPLRSIPAGGLPADAAALLVSGQEGGSLPFALLALPLPGSGERARVAVRVEIEGEALLAASAASAGAAPAGAAIPVRAEVYLYALDERGRIGGSLLEVVEVDPARLGDELAGGGVALSGEIALLPGVYTLRALVRAPGGDALGLRAVPLAVPDFRRGGAALLPPLFAAPSGGWLEATAAGGAPPALLGAARPAARAVLAPDGTATAELPAWRGGEAAEVTLELRPEGAGPDGGAMIALPARVTGRRPTPVAGLELLAVSFETKGLTPGSYALAATLGGARSAMASELVVAPGAAGTTWAQLGDAPDTTAAASAAAPGASSARPARRNRHVAAAVTRTAFREALGRLAAGESAAARAALRDLEVAELGGARPTAPEALAEVELGVAVELAAAQPEALVPVLLLYQQLHREQFEAKRYLPAAHAAEMVFTLADLYASRGGPAARPLAAHLLVALGLADLDRPLGGFALRALREALALAPDDEIALLALAVEAERRALYREAVERLERLRRLRPANREVQLRLAVNLARVGSERESQRLLEELTRAAPPAAASRDEEWPVAVAFHELARQRLAAGEPAAAEQTARAGLARFPRDEKLALLVALALDLQGRGGDARQALATMPASEEDAASPRHRYARLPEEALRRARGELERSAAERLPSLAAALAGRKGSGERPGGAR